MKHQKWPSLPSRREMYWSKCLIDVLFDKLLGKEKKDSCKIFGTASEQHLLCLYLKPLGKYMVHILLLFYVDNCWYDTGENVGFLKHTKGKQEKLWYQVCKLLASSVFWCASSETWKDNNGTNTFPEWLMMMWSCMSDKEPNSTLNSQVHK